MSWQDLERKHEQEWVTFKELKVAAWDKLEQQREHMYAAFGDDESKMSATIVQEKVEHDREEWQALWGENGMKEKYLRAIQKRELKAFKEQVKQNVLDRLRQERQQLTRSKDQERGR